MKKELKINVWDWILTKDGRIKQIISDDMMDLSYENIKRKATTKEITKAKLQKKLIEKLTIASDLISKEGCFGKAYKIISKSDYVKVEFHSQDKDNMRFRDIKTDKIYNMESRQVPGLQLMDGPFWTDKIYDAILINENTIQHPF